MERYRERRSRADVGLPPLERRRGGPRPAGLRKVDVDWLLECGDGVFQKMSTGKLRPTKDLFLKTAQVLRFSRDHLRIAYLDLYNADPVLPPEQPSPHWQRVVDGQREMACALTPTGDLIASNHAFSEAFPSGHPPKNLWRWALFVKEARDDVLLDWDKAWAPHLLTEIKLTRFRHPAASEIHTLYEDITQAPHLQHITESDFGLDGSARPIRHATRGVGNARFMAADGGGVKIVTILFEPSV
ncbi:sulfotransferase [Streptomyces griseoluteus]|uniref:sulfotransferase n=1 Tax=Streptomyces griseoluteus TaxID=29306 RepID=UPI00368D1FCE